MTIKELMQARKIGRAVGLKLTWEVDPDYYQIGSMVVRLRGGRLLLLRIRVLGASEAGGVPGVRQLEIADRNFKPPAWMLRAKGPVKTQRSGKNVTG